MADSFLSQMALPNTWPAIFVAAICLSTVCVSGDYWEERSKFLDDEASLFMGSNINLTSEEEIVNMLLMEAKKREFSTYFENQLFPPARHFFHAKADIDESEVFNILKNLPKGGLLHGHDTGMVSLDYLIGNITYRSQLYACVNISQENLNQSSIMQFIFSANEPTTFVENCQWIFLENIRKQFGNEPVDQWLRQELSLITPNPREKYPNVDVVWDFFNDLFMRVHGMLTYEPVFRDCYLQILEELRQDNIMYLELRGTVPTLYDLDGNKLEGAEVVSIYKEATADFIKEHPDFFGAKYIFAPLRLVDNATVADYMSLVRDLHILFPDFLAGFDFVGQEDKGRPLSDFVDSVLSLPSDLKLFFHAGETNWQGMTDLNLMDAILLNTTRIGHGYALTKHPLAMKMVKERGIGIEVNPISNQVLALVADLRNHPAASFLAEDFPVVISSDDPTYWDAIGLSYDFYETFMGLAGLNADLRFLKRLSLNSITYSAMSEMEKEKALEAWEVKWNQFIRKTISREHYGPQLIFNNIKK